jgi:hypothetical protein
MSAFIVSEATISLVVDAIATPEERSQATTTKPFHDDALALARSVLAGDITAATALADAIHEHTNTQTAMIDGLTALGRELYRMNQAAVIARYGDRPNDSYQAIPDYTFREPREGEEADWRVTVEESPASSAVACLLHQCSEGDVPNWPLFKRLEAAHARLQAEWKASAATRHKADGEAKAAKKAAEREEHIRNYPHLLKTTDRSDWRQARLAAENIRRELKRQYPKIKFSVRSDNNSVNIGWTNGPTEKEVEATTDKYLAGSFDGMTDCYRYDHDNVFSDIFGSAHYIFCSRSWTLESIRRAWKAKVGTDEEIPEDWNRRFDDNDRAIHIRRVFRETSFSY